MEAVLLNSGGIDILASIIKLKEADTDLILHSITIFNGRPSDERTRVSAKLIADEYCISHEEIILPGTWTAPDLAGNLTKFPYQTTMFHILAAAKARQKQLEYIVSGIDHAFSETYNRKLCALLEQETRSPYIVIPIHPVKSLSRDERMQIVKDHPLAKFTVSCGEAEPCFECSKCMSRVKYNIAVN